MTSWLFWPNKVLERTAAPLHDLGLLALRLWVGQEFLLAAWTKVSAGAQAPEWFAGLNFPWPQALLPANANWVLAGYGELLLSIALLLGLSSRVAALGLLYITFVAVYTVHFDLGWAGWNQIEGVEGMGFKVPLMLGLMLLAVFTQGPGRYALDTLVGRRGKALDDDPPHRQRHAPTGSA
jgi:putative oxidoreductase